MSSIAHDNQYSFEILSLLVEKLTIYTQRIKASGRHFVYFSFPLKSSVSGGKSLIFRVEETFAEMLAPWLWLWAELSLCFLI